MHDRGRHRAAVLHELGGTSTREIGVPGAAEELLHLVVALAKRGTKRSGRHRDLPGTSLVHLVALQETVGLVEEAALQLVLGDRVLVSRQHGLIRDAATLAKSLLVGGHPRLHFPKTVLTDTLRQTHADLGGPDHLLQVGRTHLKIAALGAELLEAGIVRLHRGDLLLVAGQVHVELLHLHGDQTLEPRLLPVEAHRGLELGLLLAHLGLRHALPARVELLVVLSLRLQSTLELLPLLRHLLAFQPHLLLGEGEVHLGPLVLRCEAEGLGSGRKASEELVGVAGNRAHAKAPKLGTAMFSMPGVVAPARYPLRPANMLTNCWGFCRIISATD